MFRNEQHKYGQKINDSQSTPPADYDLRHRHPTIAPTSLRGVPPPLPANRA
jgi:hypothetical protein